MKKLLIFLLALTIFEIGFSQPNFNHTVSNPTGAITNTSSDTMSVTLTYGHKVVAIQPVITRNTGTLAGTVILFRSVNGTAWVNDLGDTLTLTNGATSVPKVWDKFTACRYWRIITTGSGTVTATTAAKIQTD